MSHNQSMGTAQAPARTRHSARAAAAKETVNTEEKDRREALLDAAVRVIAAEGMRGLTHRAVENEAGVPHGSTTYYFGSRRDLIVAIMQHIADQARRGAEPIARGLTLMMADRSKPVDLDAVGDALIQWIDAFADMERARYELQISAVRDPETMRLATETCDQFRVMCEPIVIACGSKNPARDAKVVQAALDGWMFSRLTQTGQSDEIIKRGLEVLLGAIGQE